MASILLRHDITIIHCNIRHLYNNRTELTHLIQEQKPEIICLNETHLRDKDRFTMRDFTIYRRDRPTIGGGVMIMTNKNLTTTQIPLPLHLDDQECVIIQIHIGNSRMHVASFYSPPANPLPSTLLRYLHTLPNVIITTDINAHHPFLHDNNRNTKGNHLVTLLPSLNLVQVPLPAPTRLPTPTQQFTTPDKIFISPRLHNRLINTLVLPPLNSDHAPILIKLACPFYRSQPVNEAIYMRDYRNADWQKFKDYISKSLPHFPITKHEDLDTAETLFVQVLNEAIQDSIPQKRYTTDRRRALPPDILKIIKTKRAAHRLYMRTHEDEDRRLYRSLQEDVKDAIQRYETRRWDKFIQKVDKDRLNAPKRFWETIKRIRGKYQYTSHPLRNRQQTIIDTPGKLEVFRQFLSNTHTTPIHPDFDQDHYHFITDHINNHHILYNPLPAPAPRSTDDPIIDDITILDISLALQTCKNSAPGPDGITYQTLKQLPPTALNFLAGLFTLSLKLGHAPTRWRHSHILLFPKPGKDASDPANYRPISLTPTIAKLMEKVLVSRLQVYLRDRNMIPDSQAGFRPGVQPTDQLIRVLTPIEEAYSKRHYSILVALDARRAFDTVWLDALRYKLTNMQFPHEITRWISSFLNNRSGQVRLGRQDLSRTFQIEAGVPQGSVISPLLYNIYVSDIPQPNNNQVGLAQFADDVAFWATHPRLRSARVLIDNALRQYTEWANTWRITINTEKTQTCVFRPSLKSRITNRQHITIGQALIPLQHKVTYLGIPLTSKLSWTTIAQTIWDKYNKATKAVSYLSGIRRQGCHANTLLHLYKALVRSQCTYSSYFLLQSSPSTQKKFESRERKLLRQIFRLPKHTRNDTVYIHTKTKPLSTHLIRTVTKYTHFALRRSYTQHMFNNPPHTNKNTTIEKLLQAYQDHFNPQNNH